MGKFVKIKGGVKYIKVMTVINLPLKLSLHQFIPKNKITGCNTRSSFVDLI